MSDNIVSFFMKHTTMVVGSVEAHYNVRYKEPRGYGLKVKP